MKKVIFENAVLKVTAELQINQSEEAQRYAALNRAATVAKRDGDWDRAISLLYEAKAIHGDLYEDTRLAKFLQQAGRFDDAVTEVRWLLEHANARTEQRFSHQPRLIRRSLQASYIARLHGVATLICKRQKRYDLRQLHEQEQVRWWAIHEQLAPLAEQERQRQRDEWATARTGGRETMNAYLKKRRLDQNSLDKEPR